MSGISWETLTICLFVFVSGSHSLASDGHLTRLHFLMQIYDPCLKIYHTGTDGTTVGVLL